MRNLFVLFLSILCSAHLFAIEYTIKGKVTGTEKATVSAYAAANPFIVSSDIDAEGNFILKGEIPVASQVMIMFEGGGKTSGYEIYVFKNASIVADIDVSGQYPDWKMTGVSARSEDKYEKTPSIKRSYVAKLKDVVNKDSLFAEFEKEVFTLLGGDDMARVTAKSVRFQLMNVVRTPEMKRYYDIFSQPDFKELPLNDPAYSGIPYYNGIMEDYNMRLISDSLKEVNNDSTYFASFKELLELVEQRKEAMPQPIFLSMKFSSFHRYREGQGTKADEKDYLKAVEDFLAAHPGYRSEDYLKQKYDQIKNSLIGKAAPVFTLTDTTENEHKFPNTQGKYVLVDVWGSWCAPCRFYNKKLVEMYPRLKETGKIEFVSIAFDPNKDAWKQAIVEDGLQWPQLYSTPEFISSYHITAYPTMFLLSPEGVVVKKGHLSEEALMEYVK